MTTEYHASTRCAKCGATVMVEKRTGVKARLLRALALASHQRALHQKVRWSAR